MLISITELIKRSYNLYKDNFLTIFKYLLLALAPSVLAVLIMASGMLLFKVAGDFVTGPIMFILMPLAAIAFIIIIILGMWFNFALVRVIDLLNKKTAIPTMKDALNTAKAVVWRGLGMTILVGLYTAWPLFLGLCGFAISTFVLGPSIVLKIIFGLITLYGIFHLVYFSVKLVFSVYAVVIDNKKVKESMELSRSIVKGIWWKMLWRLLVPALAVYVVLMIINVILAAVGGLFGDIGGNIAGFVASIINFLITPYVMAVTIILFDEAKKTPAATVPQV